MSPRKISFNDLLGEFRPGRTVYIPGASGELETLRQGLVAEPDRLAGVRLVSCLVPGMNGFDYAGLNPDARLTTFLMPSALRSSFAVGRVEVLPLSYSGIAEHLSSLAPDVAILHLTPPVGGLCTFGVCADFGPIVAKHARLRIGVLNPSLPRPNLGPSIALEDLDAVVEAGEPPRVYSEALPSPALELIAEQVVDLAWDGAAIQTGIGQAPSAVWDELARRRRGLRLRSGMVTPGFLRALEAGALAEGGHIAGVAFGDTRLLDALDGTDLVTFADARTTHGPGLSGVANLVAINSALEVDLFGQANLEWAGGRLMSGVGGAPDFMRAACLNPGGRAVLALPSTTRDGASRIVVRLTAPTASLPREAADAIVTEHGVALVRDLSLDQRAQALLAIADPHHREHLERAWAEVRASL